MQPEKPVGYIFKMHYGETKNYSEQKIKKMAVSGLCLKRKRRPKKAQS